LTQPSIPRDQFKWRTNAAGEYSREQPLSPPHTNPPRLPPSRASRALCRYQLF